MTRQQRRRRAGARVGDLILSRHGHIGVITRSYKYDYPSFGAHLVFEGKFVRVSVTDTDTVIAR